MTSNHLHRLGNILDYHNMQYEVNLRYHTRWPSTSISGLKNEYSPGVWGLGIIIPLLKSGDSINVNNYRGVTVNSCLSKLFMLLLNNRLQELCDRKGIIIFYNQIYFRKLFRTADHVFTLKTLIDKAFSEGKELYFCFVDFWKVYDTVWGNGLSC